MNLSPAERRALARALALEGLRACGARRLLAGALGSLPPRTDVARTFVIAVGKAADPMLDAWLAVGTRVEAVVLAAPAPIAREGLPIRQFAGGHPRPNDESVAAARAALHLAAQARRRDRVVALLSGGASALMAAPAPPVTLGDKIELTRWLLGRGVSIDALNTVRKHLSNVKGGRLAQAAQVPVETFALSDVSHPRDDDPSTIGSGPTVVDPTTYLDAWRVLDEVDRKWPTRWPQVRARLRDGLDGRVSETLKPGNALPAGAAYTVIGNRHTAARAAAALAGREGLSVRVRQTAVDGEARLAARAFVAEALAFADEAGRPCCLIGSGETTVTVTGAGIGGRNQEFALAAAAVLHDLGRAATIVSLGTDGVDGPTPAAGAIVDEGTVARGAASGRDAWRAVDDNDSHRYLAALDETLVTGPTDSNVGDLIVAVVP